MVHHPLQLLKEQSWVNYMTLSIMGMLAFKYTAVSARGRAALTSTHQLLAVCLSLPFCLHRTETQESSYSSIKSASDKRAKLQRTLQSGDKDHIEFAIPEGYRSLLQVKGFGGSRS